MSEMLEKLQRRAATVGLTVEETGDPSEVRTEVFVISYYGVPKLRSDYHGICQYITGWADSRNTLDPCPKEFGCPQCACEAAEKDPDGVLATYYIQVENNAKRLHPIEVRKGELPHASMLEKTGFLMTADGSMVTLIRKDEDILRPKMDKLYGVTHDADSHVHMLIAPVNFANFWVMAWNSCMDYHRAMAVE